MITRRIVSIVALVVALFAGVTAAPASAEQADPADLTYHYRYDLWVESAFTPEHLTSMVASRLTRYFTFDSNCSYLPPVGTQCDLYNVPGLPLLGSNPVMVIDRSPTSWTFRSMPGHAEGAGRFITFSFVHGPYGYVLDVASWGVWTPAAELTVSSGGARAAWQRFADNISRLL
ncbi:hypothetical protein [Actinokineospora sp.]|uniref:hypothetical protein n=1 Tax=Actinokineospora sp. TaxID=1872133 RepID=UPI003D6AC7D7